MITYITTWLKKNHWMHDWGKWEEKVYQRTIITRDGKSLSANESFQDRQCSVCGKKESERL